MALLQESEERRTLALSAGDMGAWDLDVQTGKYGWDEGNTGLFGVDPDSFVPTCMRQYTRDASSR